MNIIEQYINNREVVNKRANEIGGIVEAMSWDIDYEPERFDSSISHTENLAGVYFKEDTVIIQWEYVEPWEDWYPKESRLYVPTELFLNGTKGQLVEHYKAEALRDYKDEQVRRLREVLYEVQSLREEYNRLDMVTLLCDAYNGENIVKMLREYNVREYI